MTERYKTVSQISEMFSMDRRSVKKKLGDLNSVGTEGKAEYYDMVEVLNRLREVKTEDDNRKALLEAELKYEQVRAEKVQLELEKLKQEVVPIEEVQKKWAEIATKTKNKVLGVSSKIKQRHPEISMEVFASLEATHWEALEELANESDSEVHKSVQGSDTASEEA